MCFIPHPSSLIPSKKGGIMATADMEDLKPAAEIKREPKINVFFRSVMKHESSDLHMKVGLPPMMRLKGVIRKMDHPPITEEQMERLFFEFMTPKQRTTLDETGGSDFAHVIGHDESRF